MGQILATLRAFFDGLGDIVDILFDAFAGLHDERLPIADPPQPHAQEPSVKWPSDVAKLEDYDIPAAFGLVRDVRTTLTFSLIFLSPIQRTLTNTKPQLHAATRPLLTLLVQKQGSIRPSPIKDTVHRALRIDYLMVNAHTIHNNYLKEYNDMTSTADAWEMEVEADDTDEALAESMMKAWIRLMATVQEGYGKLFEAAVEIIAVGKETREELEKLGVWSVLTERDDEDDQEVSVAEFRAMLATLD